jgi:DNA-binding IclR family transcriptional regulator
MRNSDGDAVLDRAFRLLWAFRSAPTELTLNDLATRSGLARSTAHRLVGQLVEQRMPAHCTALGKALLAFSEDVGVDWLAGHTPLERRTSRTLVDPALLRRELHDVRRARLAYDRQEASPGLTCVAAPILSPNGTARAAMSVSMPVSGRLTPAQAAPPVLAAGLALTRELNRAGQPAEPGGGEAHRSASGSRRFVSAQSGSRRKLGNHA